jgi:hypothetical protein
MKKVRFTMMLAVALTPGYVGCGGFGSPTAPDSTSGVVAGNAADMGNPADESHHALRGWGAINPEPSVPPEPGADRTSRYQLVRLANSLDLVVSQSDTAYTLVFRTQDGSCDDSFDVYVNGTGPLYRYRHRNSSDLFPVHRVPIDASIVKTTTVNVSFLNVAVDNCGFAAVYYVRVE